MTCYSTDYIDFCNYNQEKSSNFENQYNDVYKYLKLNERPQKFKGAQKKNSFKMWKKNIRGKSYSFLFKYD